jgi:hypothetical protein
MTVGDWSQAITAAIAGLAFALSAYTFYVQRRDQHPHLTLTPYQRFGHRSSPVFNEFILVNRGKLRVTITDAYLEAKGQRNQRYRWESVDLVELHSSSEKSALPPSLRDPYGSRRKSLTLPRQIEPAESVGVTFAGHDEFLSEMGFTGTVWASLTLIDTMGNRYIRRIPVMINDQEPSLTVRWRRRWSRFRWLSWLPQ